MINLDDAKRLLIRESGFADDVKRRDSDPSLGLAHLLARTTTLKTYPATAQCYYACQPLKLLGAELEGGPGGALAGGGPGGGEGAGRARQRSRVCGCG